ncbi:DUF6463 family protein [Ornithinimicrobium murale]|uniref:DUF6463 family protein n=1 Tax=Ornithinimicrobium murale TaxID=1050153 RepID=UPI0013B42946|nr:DUF6463 family protein [Ornithinimicrobium murale]
MSTPHHNTTDTTDHGVPDGTAHGLSEGVPMIRRRADRLTAAAGWCTVAIAVLHTLVFAFNPHWGVWLEGMTRTAPLEGEAVTVFWALPGGFVVPLAMLGLLLVDAGRRGREVARHVGWVLLGWVLICFWIVGPSGFLLGLVPAALLLWPRRA